MVALNKLLDGSNDEYRGQLADVVEKEEKLELDMVGIPYIAHTECTLTGQKVTFLLAD